MPGSGLTFRPFDKLRYELEGEVRTSPSVMLMF